MCLELPLQTRLCCGFCTELFRIHSYGSYSGRLLIISKYNVNSHFRGIKQSFNLLMFHNMERGK